MELATGLAWNDGQLVARGIGKSDSPVEFPCSDLGVRGLPTLEGYSRRVSTDLRTWRPASFDEYAFAFNRVAPDGQGHSVWSFQVGTMRLVVPALALLRALVLPRRLLPSLFKPQSLDDVCTFSGRGDGLIESAGSGIDRRTRMELSAAGPMSWFYCFPSARRAWASVYLASREGRLSLDLPSASVTFSIKSKRANSNGYVTSMHLIDIEATENPFDFAATHPRSIKVSGPADGGRSRASSRRRALGTGLMFSPLSNAEWSVLRETMQLGSGQVSKQGRELLNCVLEKLETQQGWVPLAQKYGVNDRTAAVALSRWRADGRLKRALDSLQRQRGSLIDVRL